MRMQEKKRRKNTFKNNIKPQNVLIINISIIKIVTSLKTANAKNTKLY